MKKIILLISILLLSGCANYITLNELDIVSTLAIDYKDNKYHITVEVEENKKEGENTSKIYEGEGISLDKAIQNTALKTNKSLYFIDLDSLILSEEVANKKMDSMIDYITRENNFSFNFKIFIGENHKSIFNIIKEKDAIAGQYLREIIDSDFNNTIDISCGDFLEIYLNGFKNIILPKIELDNDNVLVNKAVLFSHKKIVYEMNLKEIAVYNILNNNPQGIKLFNIEYENKQLIFRTDKLKTKYKYKDNKLNITITISGIFDEMDSINLDDKELSKKLIKLVDKKIKNDTNTFLNTLKAYESDPLALKKIVYNKTRNKEIKLHDINIELETKIILDRKGLIYNSIGEFYERFN